MPLYLLSEELFFPPVADALPEGLLAIGGDLSVPRLLLAYENGIFPWYSNNDPIMWWSPDPRCLLYHSKLKVSKSMRNVLNRNNYRITFDQEFDAVIEACAKIERKGEDGTWITKDIKSSYVALHELGLAHSVEVWMDDELAGGLYGVSLGGMFFGESMFSKRSNASKIAFIHLSHVLAEKGFLAVDCQVMNSHLASLGAINVPRVDFISLLNESLKMPTIKGTWEAF